MASRASKPVGRSAPAKTVASSTTINLRVPQKTRQLIDAAAATLGKSRTEFMLESARLHATDVMLDQRLFVLDQDQHDALMRVLDNPPPPNAALRKLLAGKSPWES